MCMLSLPLPDVACDCSGIRGCKGRRGKESFRNRTVSHPRPSRVFPQTDTRVQAPTPVLERSLPGARIDTVSFGRNVFFFFPPLLKPWQGRKGGSRDFAVPSAKLD